MKENRKLESKKINQGLSGIFTKRVRLFLIIFLMVLPALMALLFIKRYGVNVVFWDQWEVVPLFDKLHTGHLTFADFFAQHNEHRIFFPKLIMLLLGIITHYNNIAEMYFSWFLICLTGYVLFRAYIRTFGRTEGVLIKFIPVVWLLFSLRQWENLLWGLQISFYVVILFLLMALYFLGRSRNLGWTFAFSAISGVVCSLSLTNGLLVWPIGLMQIFLTFRSQPKELKRPYLKMASVWSVIGFVVCMVFFWGYALPQSHQDLLNFVHHPLSSLSYLLLSIGSPLVGEQLLAMGTGVLLLVMYIWIVILSVKNVLVKEPLIAFHLSLIFFTLLSIALLIIGRSGLGDAQALSSRYTSITALGIIGLYCLILSLKTIHHRIHIFLYDFLLLLIILGIAASDLGAIVVAGKSIEASRKTGAYYLSTYKIQSDQDLAQLYPVPQIVRERAEILEKYGLNVFHQPQIDSRELSPVGGSTLYSIDRVNERPLDKDSAPVIIEAQKEETITISGWAVDRNAGKAAGGVFLNIDGQRDIPALYGLDRLDVAENFKEDSYRFSGYSVSFATAILEKGQHTLSLKIVTADIKGYYQPDQKIILEVR